MFNKKSQILVNFLKKLRIVTSGFLLLLSIFTVVSAFAATTTNTNVMLLITQGLTLIPPQLSVNPTRIRQGGDIAFTTTSLKYSDNSIASNIVCKIIITSPDNTQIILQGKTNASGLCNYTANQSLASQSLVLIQGTLTDINQKIGFSSVLVQYTLGPSTVQTNTVFYEVFIDQIVLNLYKDRPDQDVYPNQPMTIQADVRNPNAFDLQTVETTIKVDTSKLRLTANSVQVGNSIRGSKYTSFIPFLKGIEVNAQAGNSQTNVQYTSDGFKVSFPSMSSGQTIPLTFQVTPLTILSTGINGTSTIISSGSVSQSNLSLGPQNDPIQPIFTIIRTGGASFFGLILLSIFLAIGVFFVTKLKEEEVEVKIS